MIWSNINRIIKGGFLNFWRNGVISLSSILIMVIALFMIGSTILISVFLNSALENLRERVDVNVYITQGVDEEDVLAMKKKLELLPEVDFVEFISEEQVLKGFIERHSDDQLTSQALEEVGDNPFGAILNIKAKDPSQYSSIENFLSTEEGLLSKAGYTIIDNTNYQRNKTAIDRLSQLIDGIQKTGIIATTTLIAISVLITFNTIRLAIYTTREEITVMRLVGARNYYIRGPFIVEGILYGVISALITIALFYPITMWIRNSTKGVYEGINLFQYYVSNFAEIFLILMASGVLLGAISSYLAVRRYLKK